MQTVFVYDAAVPIVTFPKLTLTGLPVIAYLSIKLHGASMENKYCATQFSDWGVSSNKSLKMPLSITDNNNP